MNNREAEQYIVMLEQMRASRHGWESDRFGEEDVATSQGSTNGTSGAVLTPRHPNYIDGDGNPQVYPERVKMPF